MKKIITERNLISKIWFQPTETLNFIINNCPEKYVTILIVLGGLVNALDKAFTRNSNSDKSLIEVLPIAIIIGLLFGWITYYIYAYALSIVGEWIGGKSQPKDFRTIIGWALVPLISTLILLIPQIFIFGDDLLLEDYDNENIILTMIYLGFIIIEFVLAIWSLVIFVKGIMIIQEFRIGKAILNMIMPGLMILIPIFLVIGISQIFM